jgi:hypothetical protein
MHNHHHNGAGHAPPNEEGPAATPVAPAPKQTTNTPHFVRRFHELQARLLKRGFKLKRSADGELLILRWDCCKFVPDLDGAEEFAQKVGAK